MGTFQSSMSIALDLDGPLPSSLLGQRFDPLLFLGMPRTHQSQTKGDILFFSQIQKEIATGRAAPLIPLRRCVENFHSPLLTFCTIPLSSTKIAWVCVPPPSQPIAYSITNHSFSTLEFSARDSLY